jgi:predicted MFS family arabinose efflux permease
MPPPWRNLTFLALQYRNFQYYSLGQMVNLAGTRIHEVAAGWLMWQLTGSAAWVGALALVEMAPRLLLWPIAGALTDRIDRRKLAIVFQAIAAVEAGCLAALNGAGYVGVYTLLAFTALLGVNTAFFQPIRLAIIPRLVSREAMSSAVALSSVTANVARVFGPVIAGPVLVWGSVTLAFWLNTASYFAVVLAFWLMDLPESDKAEKGRTKMTVRDLSFGLSMVLRDPGVRTLLLLIGIFAICVRPISDLLPVFAEAVLGAGPVGLAALTSALGFGSLFSGLMLSSRRRQDGLVTLLAAAGAIGSIMAAVFSVASNVTVAMVCIAIMGFGVTLTNIVAQILLQLALTDDVRGRVFSVYGVLFSCAPGLGALAMGWTADRIGVAPPVLFGAAIGLAASLAIFLNRHRLAALLDPQSRASED